MKTFLTIVVATSAGAFVGFASALFFQALAQMTAEENARQSYLTYDPWDVMPDEYDKQKDDKLTN
jgi:hypothetical protein